MEKTKDYGTWTCFLLNLVHRLWWLGIFAILLVLHIVLNWPMWLIWIPVACWMLHALIDTALVVWANKCSNVIPKQENKNPYSKK